MSDQQDKIERQVAMAMFALDTMADEWAESTRLWTQMRSIVSTDEQANKLTALMKQAWVEGAYAGRMSQFTDPPESRGSDSAAGDA